MSTSTERAKNHPPTAPHGRKRVPAMVLACVAVLVSALIGGSLFWLLRVNSGRPAGPRKVASTATATTIPTWTPTELTPPPESLFYDTFVNNSHGWSLAGGTGFLRILTNNTLILSNTNPNTTLVESVPTSTNLDNYVASIDFTINKGDSHDSTGLYLRGDSNLDHDYRIDINSDNTMDVAKEALDADQAPQNTMLVPPQHSSELNPPGQQNTLTVMMIGPTLTVSINGFVLAAVSDPSYTNGQIALFARHGDSSTGVIVSFTRVEIDHLASQFATPLPTLTPTTGAGQH